MDAKLLLPAFLSILVLFACDKDTSDPIDNEPTGDDPIVLTCADFDRDITLEHKEGRAVDYIIDCLVDVDDIEINISENTVVEFEPGSGLMINGDAKLTIVSMEESERVILRGTERNAGHWKGICLNSNHDLNRITNAFIGDAGDPTDERFKGAITVKTHGWITDTEISDVEGHGIYVYDRANIRSGLIGIKVSNTSDFPISVPIPQWGKFYDIIPPATVYGSVTLTDCIPNKIEVRGSSELDLQMINADIFGLDYPYVLEGDIMVPRTSRLKLLAGTQLEMKRGARIYVSGSFAVVGVSNNPVLMYGERDEKGYWGGVHIDRQNATGPNGIDYLHISNGGGGPFENANLTLKNGTYIVENSIITKSGTCGIRYFAGLTMLSEQNNTFSENDEGDICEN
jgi:hypothetical protein